MIRYAFIALLAFAAPVSAHAIRMNIDITATELVATVRYDGADRDGGPIEVTLERVDPKEHIAKVKLGDDGKCIFPRPPAGRYRLIARDDFGHRAEIPLDLSSQFDSGSQKSWTKTSNGYLTMAGFGIIGVLTLVGWWYAGRKKTHAA